MTRWGWIRMHSCRVLHGIKSGRACIEMGGRQTPAPFLCRGGWLSLPSPTPHYPSVGWPRHRGDLASSRSVAARGCRSLPGTLNAEFIIQVADRIIKAMETRISDQRRAWWVPEQFLLPMENQGVLTTTVILALKGVPPPLIWIGKDHGLSSNDISAPGLSMELYPAS